MSSHAVHRFGTHRDRSAAFGTRAFTLEAARIAVSPASWLLLLLLSACSAAAELATPAELPPAPSAEPPAPALESLAPTLPPAQIEAFDAVAATLSMPLETAEPIRLRFVGDVIFGRYREGLHQRLAADTDPVFADVAQLLAGDWLVANLETPLASEVPEASTRPGYFFGATAQMAAPLVDAGFDAVSLANNHAADLGVEGLRQTPRILRELGIEPFGEASMAPHPAVQSVEVQGMRIGVVAVTAHANFPMPPQAPAVPLVGVGDLANVIGPLLSEAHATHDLLVVMVHWGVEYSRYPENGQRKAARALIDQGADLVIGHHPHVLQEVELYGGGLIAYSLGNFLFENASPEPKLTGVLGVDLARPSWCEVSVRFDPAVMQRSPYVHPVAATQGTAALARRRITPLEKSQNAQWEQSGESLVAHFRRARCGDSE